MSRITGNKGEWSEIYVLLRLIAERKIYASDSNLHKMENIYFPILNIFRDEKNYGNMNYDLSDENNVKILIDNQLVYQQTYKSFQKEADYLLAELQKTDKHGSFSILRTEAFMDVINCHKLAASSSDKSDIIMKIHDYNNGYEPICGFSIKSELGALPTLVNASKATNFIYKIENMNDTEMKRINGIVTDTKIKDRMFELTKSFQVDFSKMNNQTFYNNLMKVDSLLPQIMAHAMVYHFRDNIKTCKDVVDKLEIENPLKYPSKGFYEYKFKKFLCSVALGMVPSKEWSGIDEATGGYIVVRNDGEVLAFYIYNRNVFEQYLLDNTKFERGSVNKHDYASIYKDNNDEYFINLNLSIRFMK